MKILVTGGAGYIGATVCSLLIDAGHVPIILDSFVTGRREFVSKRIYYEGDISNHILLKKIKQEHPDIKCCIHLAARIFVPESVRNPSLYYLENVSKSISLLNTLNLLGIRKIIFSSSASVYQTNEQFLVTEDSPIKPISPYSRTKWATEMILEDFCNANYFKCITFRYFNPIGADSKMRSGPYFSESSHILDKLINITKGIESTFFIAGTDWPTRDGTALRDYIHINDLAHAHVLAVEKIDRIFEENNMKYMAFNLGSGFGITVREFIKAFINVYGKNIPISIAERRLGDVAGVYASCDKAKKYLGWNTKYTVEEAIRDAINWTDNERVKILGF